MSYDLSFWKEKPGIKLDAQITYERLLNRERVEGVEELPIEKILERVKGEFRQEWTQLDNVTWEGPHMAFQVYTTPQFFRIDCYGMTSDEMNVFIDIACEFGCPLYDPQAGKRYDGT